MRKPILASLAVLLLARAAAAQTDPHVVTLPSLSISSVDTSVTYDGSRGVYGYEYTINAAATNKASISMLSVDINGHGHQRLPR